MQSFNSCFCKHKLELQKEKQHQQKKIHKRETFSLARSFEKQKRGDHQQKGGQYPLKVR